MTSNSNNSNSITNMNTSNIDDLTQIFGPQRDSLYIVIPITIIYIIIFITGLCGNTLTCVVIRRNKNMQTVTNFYLFSLSISDILFLISGMPQDIYLIWVKWPYKFGNVLCVLRDLVVETSANASVLTITLFTMERYLGICHPFNAHQMSTKSRATKHVLILWAVSLSLGLLQALQFRIVTYRGVPLCLQTSTITKYAILISTILIFFVPATLITVFYILIGLKLYRRNINQDSVEDNKLRRNIHPLSIHNKAQSTTRVIKMLIAVVAAFFICWSPFHAQRLIAIYGWSVNHITESPILHSVYTFMTYSSGVFYYMSTCINPILYNMMSNKFRNAFKATILEWCCKSTAQPVGQQCCSTIVPISRNIYNRGRAENSGNPSMEENLELKTFKSQDLN